MQKLQQFKRGGGEKRLIKHKEGVFHTFEQARAKPAAALQ